MKMKPLSTRPQPSISGYWDRYERMPYWVVYYGPKSAQFPAGVYGAARAERIANDFVRQLRSGVDWTTALGLLPKE